MAVTRTDRSTCASATFSSTNPLQTGLGLNPYFRGKRPTTNRLAHGTTLTECSNTYVNKL